MLSNGPTGADASRKFAGGSVSLCLAIDVTDEHTIQVHLQQTKPALLIRIRVWRSVLIFCFVITKHLALMPLRLRPVKDIGSIL